MPKTRIGRVAACSYLLAVLCAVVSCMLAPDDISGASFTAVLILTFRLGFVGYGLLGFFALGLGRTGGAVPAIVFSVVCLVVFMGAAIVNLVTVRGLWRWCNGRRTHSARVRRAAR